ncbi:MAG: hypothetical protein ABFD58_02095 [Anaerolineaceae bacterium]
MTKQERKWIWITSVVIMVITTIPYILALSVEEDSWKFTGFLFGVEDGNSYIAKMLTGAYGNWFFTTPYTTYPQKGELAFLPYLLLGKLTSQPGQHAQLVVLFHFFRILAGCLAIVATYDFISIFIKKVQVRRFGTLLISIGGGLGWLFLIGLDGLWGDRLPLEFYSPETFGFLSLYGLPHLALGRACLLWGLCAFFDGNHPLKNIKFSGMYFVILTLVQPVTAVLGYGLLFLATAGTIFRVWLENRKEKPSILHISMENGKKLAWIVSFSLPILIYIFVSYKFDPFMQRWEQQNIITSPPITDYLLAWGWTIPFVIMAIVKMVKKEIPVQYFLLAWLLVIFPLIYFPVNIQRRLAEGVWVAFILLVLLVVENWKRSKVILSLLLVFSSLPYISILAGGIKGALDPFTPVFRPAQEVTVFEKLAQNAHARDVVLASYQISNALPAWAPVRVLSGHGPESIDANSINQEVMNFFSDSYSQTEQIQFLMKYEISYVIWGPDERALGEWNPTSSHYLQLIYDANDYALYKVNTP